MKLITVVYLIVFAGFANATVANQLVGKNAARSSNKVLGIEATLQTQGIAGDSSPLFGPAATYKVSTRNETGLRALAPISKSMDQGAYSLAALWRYYAVESRTNLFSEVSAAYNLVRNKEFGSAALAIGARYDLATDLAFGGTAGLEFANASIKSETVSTGTLTYVYPKASIFASMFF